MDCPRCGYANEPERLACERCENLLAPQSVRPEAEPAGPSSPEFPESFSYTGDLPRLFRFGSRYQVLDKLGEGGMGRVYKALDLELDRAVALKTLRSERNVSPDVLRRFKQEMVLARGVTHKNVVRIHDLGEADGMKFFTMELVEGPTLRELLEREGPLPVKRALAIFEQLLAGLAEAHRQGVVHRDLKPQNVLIDESGTVRIMDFGIARAAGSVTMTSTSELIGTPDYMSPEQAKGENADARSDLYAAGIVLFELLTGELPFAGETPLARLMARVQKAPRAPRSVRPELPVYVERILWKLLEADPELRYQSAEEVRADLERERVDRSPLLRLKKLVRRHRASAVAAATALSLVVVLAGRLREGDSVVVAEEEVTTVAVLPYERHSQASTGMEELEGVDAFLQFLEWNFTAFPDWHEEIELMVAEGDFVAYVTTGTGTQSGPMGEVPATGKTIRVQNFVVHRFERERIAETWVGWDNLSVLGQLGLFQPPTDSD